MPLTESTGILKMLPHIRKCMVHYAPITAEWHKSSHLISECTIIMKRTISMIFTVPLHKITRCVSVGVNRAHSYTTSCQVVFLLEGWGSLFASLYLNPVAPCSTGFIHPLVLITFCSFHAQCVITPLNLTPCVWLRLCVIIKFSMLSTIKRGGGA